MVVYPWLNVVRSVVDVLIGPTPASLNAPMMYGAGRRGAPVGPRRLIGRPVLVVVLAGNTRPPRAPFAHGRSQVSPAGQSPRSRSACDTRSSIRCTNRRPRRSPSGKIVQAASPHSSPVSDSKVEADVPDLAGRSTERRCQATPWRIPRVEVERLRVAGGEIPCCRGEAVGPAGDHEAGRPRGEVVDLRAHAAWRVGDADDDGVAVRQQHRRATRHAVRGDELGRVGS